MTTRNLPGSKSPFFPSFIALALAGVLSLGLSLAAPAGAAEAAEGVQEGEHERVAISAATLRKVQTKLKAKGLYDGAIDGIMGPKTRRALREFQRQKGYPVSGQVTEQTLDELDIDPNQESEGVFEKVGEGLEEAGEALGQAGKATAKGSKKAAKATAKGSKKAAKATAKGAKTGAEATAEGSEETAEAVVEGSKEAADETKDFVAGEDRDGLIQERVEDRFEADSRVPQDEIDIDVEDGIVTLHFENDLRGNETAYNRAVFLAQKAQGVKRVFVRFPKAD